MLSDSCSMSEDHVATHWKKISRATVNEDHVATYKSKKKNYKRCLSLLVVLTTDIGASSHYTLNEVLSFLIGSYYQDLLYRKKFSTVSRMKPVCKRMT